MKKSHWRPIFWMIMLSLLTITLHSLGLDSHSNILIGVNPILNALSKVSAAREFLNSGFVIHVNNMPGPRDGISVYWYVASILSFVFYGIIIKLGALLVGRKISS